MDVQFFDSHEKFIGLGVINLFAVYLSHVPELPSETDLFIINRFSQAINDLYEFWTDEEKFFLKFAKKRTGIRNSTRFL